MKLLIVAEQWFPDYAGGTARVVRETALGLADRGHEVVLIVPKCRNTPEISMVNGAEVRRVMRRGMLPETMTDVFETRRAIKRCEHSGFDLVIAHHVASAAGALSLNLRCPLALVFHASPYLEARHRRSVGLPLIDRWRSRGVEPLLYLEERLALRRADQILVLSEFSRKLVLDANSTVAGRVKVVGGGVNTHTFSPALERDALRLDLGIAPQQKLLVSARRLVSRMGLEMLLDAFHRLHDDDDRIQLVIIGEGELRQALEEQRDRLGLTCAVHFVGRVSDAELRDWYRAADVFVLPTVAYEGFGMVTAEALACGTPVVGTPVGATSELLAPLDQSLLAADANAESLTSAIRHALASPHTASRSACYKYALNHLGWDHILDRWESALTQLAATA